MDRIRVAAIQMCSTPDRDRNITRAEQLMGEALREGAQVIALPENFSFMVPEGVKITVVEDLQTGPSVGLLRAFAAQHRVAVVGGSIPLQAATPGKVTNTCLVYGPNGTLAARYDKIHLFDVSLDETETHRESRYVQPGRDAVAVELHGQMMGLSICYDLRFPELYRGLAARGARVLFVPAAFTVPTGKDHWEVLLRARAIENQCYVVAPAQFGQNYPGRSTYGRTMIVDPWGQVMALAQDKEGVVLADLDFEFLDDVRLRLPALEHRRRGSSCLSP